ncbi:MAG: hypothetical protein QXJ27_06440 [Thermoplasmata archaeon]
MNRAALDSVLVFFWHPLMSFLVPVLVFECLTGIALMNHERFLANNRARKTAIGVFSALTGAFVASGNLLNPASVALSFLGTRMKLNLWN